VNSLILLYIAYIISMTIIIAYFLELSLRGVKFAFIPLEITFVMTLVFFIIITLNFIIISLLISIWFFVIPRVFYSLGFVKISSVISVIFHEIIMSLIYYVIIRQSLGYAIQSLYFYGTDIPSFGLPLQNLIIPAVLETVNSFMFFLMFYPEVVYVLLRRRDYYSLYLSVLIFLEPNIASEMTHAILPLPYDPIPQFSLLAFIVSFTLIVYSSFALIKGKLNFNKFIIFTIINLIQSISAYYYALTINEIPYAITTLISIVILLTGLRKINQGRRVFQLFSIIPQYFWGASIAYWFHALNILYALTIIPTLILLSLSIFLILQRDSAFLRQFLRRL